MGRLYVKNWARFQHYRHRKPPWIKLHRELLDNREFLCLHVASMALAPLVWLLASESDDGSVSSNVDDLVFRLRRPREDVTSGLQGLIAAGFMTGELEDASNMLATCYHDASNLVLQSRGRDRVEREGEEHPPKRNTFKPPTQEEVTQHIKASGYTVNPVRFFSHYEANGWMVGKNRMKDWKAACRRWQSEEPLIAAPTPRSADDLRALENARRLLEEDK